MVGKEVAGNRNGGPLWPGKPDPVVAKGVCDGVRWNVETWIRV